MRQAIASSAEYWARIRNVEAVWCWLPDYQQVMDGTHVITALGNDGMAVNITVDTQSSLECSEDLMQLTQLAWLGKYLTHFRYKETVEGADLA
jgi:hypothetical protein